MKRREVLRAAALAPVLAQAQTPPLSQEEKLNRTKREIAEAMAKVHLANEDGPDLLPRPRRRR